MSKTLINEQHKKIILAKFFNLPPLSWLEECKTEDQQKHWRRVKYVCDDIRAELSCCFQDKLEPEEIQPQYNDAINQSIKLSAHSYINLYHVVFHSFHEIESIANSLNLKIPKEPCKYLCLLIENEIRCFFAQCLSYTEYNPRKVYNLSLNSRKIKALKEKTDLTKPEKALISKHEKEISKLLNHCREQTGLFLIAMDVAKKSKNTSVKNALREYQETEDELEKLRNYLFHPSKKLGSSVWNKGYLS